MKDGVHTWIIKIELIEEKKTEEEKKKEEEEKKDQ